MQMHSVMWTVYMYTAVAFEVLIYTTASAPVPSCWHETDACLIAGGQQVESVPLRAFSTGVHRVQPSVSYRDPVTSLAPESTPARCVVAHNASLHTQNSVTRFAPSSVTRAHLPSHVGDGASASAAVCTPAPGRLVLQDISSAKATPSAITVNSVKTNASSTKAYNVPSSAAAASFGQLRCLQKATPSSRPL